MLFLRRIAQFEIKNVTNLKWIVEYCNLIVISVELDHNAEKGLLKDGNIFFSNICKKGKKEQKMLSKDSD